MAFVNEEENRRVIDYTRNAILVRASGVGMSETKFFELQWNGEKVRFGTDFQQMDKPDGSWDISWTVTQMWIPKHWQTDQKTLFELRQLVTESIETYAYFYGMPRPGTVSVSFSPAIASLDFHSDAKVSQVTEGRHGH